MHVSIVDLSTVLVIEALVSQYSPCFIFQGSNSVFGDGPYFLGEDEGTSEWCFFLVDCHNGPVEAGVTGAERQVSTSCALVRIDGVGLKLVLIFGHPQH